MKNIFRSKSKMMKFHLAEQICFLGQIVITYFFYKLQLNTVRFLYVEILVT